MARGDLARTAHLRPCQHGLGVMMAKNNSDDPRAHADDIHRMDWGDYLQMAEVWRTERANRSRWPWRSLVGASAAIFVIVMLQQWPLQ